jgi:outer membrane protein assembly factor BamB
MDGSVVFVGARGPDTDVLHAFDALTGIDRWAYTSPDRLRTTPLVTASGVIVATQTSIVAVDSASGNRSWMSNQTEVQSIVLTPDSKTIIAASTQGDIFAINATDGVLRWTYPQHTPVQSGVAGGAGDILISADGTTIYFSVNQGSNATVHAIQDSGTSATHRWKAELSVGVPVSATPPALSADGSVLFVGVTSSVARLVALSAVTGTQKWTQTFNITGKGATPAQAPATPAVGADGAVYFGSTGSDGIVYCVSATGTKPLFQTFSPVNVTPALSVDGSVLYVGGNSDTQTPYIYAVDTRTGSKAWEFPTNSVVATIVSNADDSTVFVTDGKTLFAVEGAVVATRSPSGTAVPTAVPNPAGGDSGDGSNKTKGVIIGVVAGVLVVLIIVVAVVVVRKRNSFQSKTNVVETL